jgi:hypothetical protein
VNGWILAVSRCAHSTRSERCWSVARRP